MAQCNDGLCQDCIYGSQPWGYFPIFCVHGKRTKTLWREKTACADFERAPEPPEPPKQVPWQVIKCNG